jgi:hypothetical protein
MVRKKSENIEKMDFLLKGSLNTKYLRARERANVYERASSFL